MQRIVFIALVFCIGGLASKAQSPVPPKRTSDPVAFRPRTVATLQMKGGGAGAAPQTTNAVVPLSTSNGGGGSGSTAGKQPVGLAGVTPQRQNNSKPLRPSDVAVKQDSLGRH